MRKKQSQHDAAHSLQLLDEQAGVLCQLHGWHGVLVRDFPVFVPAWGEILYAVSGQEFALIPIEEHGTLLVFLTQGYDPYQGPLPEVTAQAVLFTPGGSERRTKQVTSPNARSCEA